MGMRVLKKTKKIDFQFTNIHFADFWTDNNCDFVAFYENN